jgi:hypothetical protein
MHSCAACAKEETALRSRTGSFKYMAMIYASAAAFDLQAMATTKQSELLRQALEAAGLTPTQLGKKLDYGNAYFQVWQYMTGRPMGPRVQKKFAQALDLPDDYFADPDRTALRQARNQRVYDLFMTSEDGRAADPAELAAIRRMLPTMSAPTVDTLKAVLFALRNRGTMPTEQEIELNTMLESSPRPKPLRSVRKPPKG